jgi:uncharacterized RDD family membrane protein YckC
VNQWMIGINGVKYGPYDEGSVRAMMESGRIPPTALAWRAGMTGWASVSVVFSATQSSATQSSATQPHTAAVRYAGFWQRVGAELIDTILLATGMSVLWRVVTQIVNAMEPRNSLGLILALWCGTFVIMVVMYWLYFAVQESASRQATVGKLAFGIRVTDLQGNRVSFGRATGRYFAKIVTGISLGIGYLVMLWSQQRQCIHDQIAGTLVVRN